MAISNMKMSLAGHAAGIYADMSVDGPQIGTLVVIIDRAKNLPNRKTMGKQNPYCAARLGKEAKKTETDMRGGQTPKWDQELRFTVHESPDYYSLKVSVFNDDKRTDLIGETWIDLGKVIIPGGGQSDQWHGLRFKGKYAGDVRIEMTYYDTRPEDEAVIERRKVVGKPPGVNNASSNSKPLSLSGPRELNVKRRPLPDNPTKPPSSRASLSEQVPRMPAGAPEGINQPFPQSQPQDMVPHLSHHDPSTPPTSRTYESPDDISWERPLYHHRPSGPNQVPASAPYAPKPRLMARDPLNSIPPQPQDPHYSQPEYQGSYPDEQYSPRDQPMPVSHDYVQDYPPQTNDLMHGENYDMAPRQDDRIVLSQSPHWQPTDHYVDPRPSPQGSYQRGGTTHLPSPVEPPFDARTGSIETESRHPYNAPPNRMDWPRDNSMRQSPSRENGHPSYASMQPTVEDEQEELFAPPPPMHRSSGYQHSLPSPSSQNAHGSGYGVGESISPGQAHSPGRAPDIPVVYQDQQLPPTNPNMAPTRPYQSYKYSPGVSNRYDGNAATGDMGRPMYESHSARSPHHEPPEIHQTSRTFDNPPYSTSPHSQHHYPPVRDERDGFRKSRSTSPNPRGVPSRKSVSPRPSMREERESSSVPFSPDCFDSYNPQTRGPLATREGTVRGDFPEGGTSPGSQGDGHRGKEIGPIIGDDGREIDPSDHLPSDTWAPEPERKTKKPEVIIRFKNAPRTTTAKGTSASPREIRYPQPQTTVTPAESGARVGRNRLQKTNGRPLSYVQASPSSTSSPMNHSPHPTEYDPPAEDPGHQRNYSTPHAYGGGSQNLRRSVSPTPSPYNVSNYYASPQRGPPLPAKVPIAQPMNHNYPTLGMDAFSQEIQSIDIGSVGWGSGRGGRRNSPRSAVLANGYHR